MNDPSTSEGDVVLITAPYPLSREHSAFLHEYAERRLAAGKPIILEEGFDLQVRHVPPTILKSEHYGRVNELLATTNAYQERYRKAEANLKSALSRLRVRTGDHVYHYPSDETWVIAYADYLSGHLSACGWPESEAKIVDCDLVYAAPEAEYRDLLAKLTGRRGDRARSIAFRDERP